MTRGRRVASMVALTVGLALPTPVEAQLDLSGFVGR